jgi:hypothetical protein
VSSLLKACLFDGYRVRVIHEMIQHSVVNCGITFKVIPFTGLRLSQWFIVMLLNFVYFVLCGYG